VIAVSILLMVLMSGLAMSLLGMVFKATTNGSKIDLVPLSESISLIFGLSALRNVQPGVPAVGAAWGLYLLHLGRNYRGHLRHHNHLDPVAALARALVAQGAAAPAQKGTGNCVLDIGQANTFAS
jgi:hypothetical protein